MKVVWTSWASCQNKRIFQFCIWNPANYSSFLVPLSSNTPSAILMTYFTRTAIYLITGQISNENFFRSIFKQLCFCTYNIHSPFHTGWTLTFINSKTLREVILNFLSITIKYQNSLWCLVNLLLQSKTRLTRLSLVTTRIWNFTRHYKSHKNVHETLILLRPNAYMRFWNKRLVFLVRCLAQLTCLFPKAAKYAIIL